MPTETYRIVLVKYDTDSTSKGLAIYIEQTPLRMYSIIKCRAKLKYCSIFFLNESPNG